MVFDPIAILQAAGALAKAFIPTLSVLAFVLGLVLIGRAGLLMVYGREGRGVHDDVPMGSVVTHLLIGAAFVQFARTVKNNLEVLGGAGSEVRTALAYVQASASGSQVVALGIATAMAWLGAIGIAAVFRGLLLWKSGGDGSNRGGGGEVFWRGLWHIVGGGVCINIGMGNIA